MTLYNTLELLSVPHRQVGFAVGAFNVHNMEYVQAVVRTAELENAPVILMIGEAMIPFFGLDMIVTICLQATRSTPVPVAVALDHGKRRENITRCLELGIPVMYDGSHFPYEQNVVHTAEVCRLAHNLGLPVEGEMGSIGGAEDADAITPEAMTDPNRVADFVNRTGVDILAISIGNIHGLYRKPPRLDIERLKAIRRQVEVPVVMHGGSDLPAELSRQVIQEGVTKFNVGTDLKIAYSRVLKETLNREPMPFQPPQVLGPARDAVCEETRHKIRSFGSSGKAAIYRK